MTPCDCPTCRRIADDRRDSGFWDLVLDNYRPREIRRLEKWCQNGAETVPCYSAAYSLGSWPGVF